MAQTLEHNGSVTQVVPVEIPACDVDVEVIQKLDDEPNDVGGLSAQELKERFDHVGAELKAYINGKLIPTVVSDSLTEQARQAAEAERVKNEMERVAGENARTAAEAARAAAEDTRIAAETARAGAENERESAESERETGETARAAAERERSDAEEQRAQAEELRVTGETAREAAEEARVQAERQRVDTDNGIVAQATAKAAQAAESAQGAGESAGQAAGSAAAAAEARSGAEAAKSSAEELKAAAEAAKASAETAAAAAETAKTGAESRAEQAEEQAQTAVAAAAQSAAEADRAKLEADRAKAISGGDFVTPVELTEALKPKADIPLIGPAELAEELEAGGILFITEGESDAEAKTQQIAVKDKDGVLQVAELGGSGALWINGGELLKEIQIDNVSMFVYKQNTTLSWEEVAGRTANTGTVPGPEEKEMFKGPDGAYTLRRIVYDGYISPEQAESVMALGVTAIAADESHKVTCYSLGWNKVTDNGENYAPIVMNGSVLPFFGTLRDGMDDMAVAVNATPVDYDAQQRVYIDVERADGSAVDYYVLVIHNAKQYNNNVGTYDVGTYDFATPHGLGREELQAEGSAPGGYGAIWIYPDGADISACRPNAEVTLWSSEVQERIEAGDTEGLRQDQIDTVTAFGATDEWGHAYPLAFRVKVPLCERLHIRMLSENPLSGIGVAGDNPLIPSRPNITNFAQGEIDSYYGGFSLSYAADKGLQLYGGVRTQAQYMGGNNGVRDFRGFTITVEFETPAAPYNLGSAAKITFPGGLGDKTYRISDGTDTKSGKTGESELLAVLRNCNATYEVTVTNGEKTYTGQIETGPYFGQYTLSEWTEVTDE